MKRVSMALALGLIVSTAGCSNDPVDASGRAYLREAYAQLKALWTRSGTPFTLTRAQLQGVTFPVIWLEAIKNGSSGSAIPIGVNRDTVTWTMADGSTVLTQDGVVFSTRGLGPDLLSSETTQTRAALVQRHATRYQRVYRFVAGDESIRQDRYFCEMANDGPVRKVVLDYGYDTTQMRETCYSLQGAHVFRNVYWLGQDEMIWESRQWLGPEIGYLKIQRLVP